jgi:hypothetical protein
MINKLEYSLKILGENKTYLPNTDIVGKLVNQECRIFEITADNSYGKTFLLNLIAHGLGAGNLTDSILPSIKERINEYNSREYCELDYEIELNLPNGKKLLLTKEIDADTKIRLGDSALMNANNLHQKLSIIYDVPMNPSDRLDGVINDLKKWHDNLMGKFTEAMFHFNQVNRNFDIERDEEKIEEWKEQIKSEEKLFKKRVQEIKEVNSLIELFNQKLELKKLQMFTKSFNDKTKQHTKLKVQLKPLTKPTRSTPMNDNKLNTSRGRKRGLEEAFNGKISNLIERIERFKDIKDYIDQNNRLFDIYEMVKKMKLESLWPRKDYVGAYNNFHKELNELRESLLEFIDDQRQDDTYLIHNKYSSLIKILEELMHNKIDHFLKSIVSVDSRDLRAKVQELINKHTVIDYEALETFLKIDIKRAKFDEIWNNYIQVNKYIDEETKKKNAANDGHEYIQVKSKLDVLEEALAKDKNKIHETKADLKRMFGKKDSTFIDSPDKIDKNITRIEKKINNNNNNRFKNIEQADDIKSHLVALNNQSSSNLSAIQIKLDAEMAKENTKYTDKQKTKIRNLVYVLNNVIANLNGFKSLIKQFNEGNLTNVNVNKETDKLFIELAGKIIAYSMENQLLRADGVFDKLKYYDLIEKKFVLEDDSFVNKADVSTGLASANYLKQRIDNVEGESVVILLDEIGNMADTALNVVIESIKRIEKENRLALALFTRPRNEGIKVITH